ncbi:RibD family protein [Fodinicola feengrottensis]|uniref:Bacterial bifunctional deaminase-reductase C-terminal domain-containing protein n=1 Tax=Fodinicola feengrottensis TaxID=435914 RepID=A0ABN2GI92_9ACTN|nr:dihydrofolate reductase family protein [Fodinicola feengrottensis]
MTDGTDRPYVLLSCAMSVDGYIDDATPERLLLSNAADFDRVDGERAASDAIVVGANTIRRENPRLLVRSPARRRDRVAAGQPASPAKVTLTVSGDLDPAANFFADDTLTLVYCPSGVAAALRERLGDRATVVGVGASLELEAVLDDLAGRGIQRVMVEGGQSVLTTFLTSGLVDELQLAVAPFFVGDRDAPRFVGSGSFFWTPTNTMRLAGVAAIGDVALLRYRMTDRVPPR